MCLKILEMNKYYQRSEPREVAVTNGFINNDLKKSFDITHTQGILPKASLLTDNLSICLTNYKIGYKLINIIVILKRSLTNQNYKFKLITLNLIRHNSN